MTQLKLKLFQPMAYGYIESGAMARVRLLTDSGGTIAKKWWSQEKTVAVAGGNGSSGEYTVFDLPCGGHYGVDITRPRGSDILREYDIPEGGVRTEMIAMECSPHEYLGWQQYAGIVRSDLRRRETVQDSAVPKSTGIDRLDSLIQRDQGRIKALYDAVKEVPSVFAAALSASRMAWAEIGEATSGGHRSWALAEGPLDWTPSSDAEFTVWFRPMPDLEEGEKLVKHLNEKDAPRIQLDSKFPRWLSFETGGQIDLASVPWSWWGGQQDENEDIRFLYDRVRPSSTDNKAPGHLTISVHDHQWFGLLEFLASGRMNRAGDLLDDTLRKSDPEMALFSKLKGPLVAVAGSLVLIARARSDEKQKWDDWIENLSKWFPGIPDGPILLGCRQIQRAKNANELMTAYNNLNEGVERGIPFFSASIRMLDTALAQIGSDIPEADAVRRYIATVSTRVDPNQPFTVIRL